jgi:hypothetical protein
LYTTGTTFWAIWYLGFSEGIDSTPKTMVPFSPFHSDLVAYSSKSDLIIYLWSVKRELFTTLMKPTIITIFAIFFCKNFSQGNLKF